MQETKDSWQSGNPYDQFMGRWSRLIAHEFLQWLSVPVKRRWLDVGCGTGALSALVLKSKNPIEVAGVDTSAEFVRHAVETNSNSRMRFEVASAESLPSETDYFDATISGLALNFIPQPEQAIAEMTRVTKQNGTVAVYVWDYADGMQMLRYFWDAAADLDMKATEFDEGLRFPLCREDALKELFEKSDLHDIQSKPIEVPTVFQDFDDYWQPFLGQVGPAPSYVSALDETRREALRNALQTKLSVATDGTIPLVARAWAIQGRV